ncbi:MAG: hypothetical protein WDN69_09065 [Aliidongia sp.]
MSFEGSERISTVTAGWLAAEGLGQQTDDRHGGRDDAQPQFAAQPAAQALQPMAQILLIGQQPMRPVECHAAFGGEIEEGSAADDQPNAQLLLERGEAARQRRLRDVADLGGSGEVLLAR